MAFRPVCRYSTISAALQRPSPALRSLVRSGANQPCSEAPVRAAPCRRRRHSWAYGRRRNGPGRSPDRRRGSRPRFCADRRHKAAGLKNSMFQPAITKRRLKGKRSWLTLTLFFTGLTVLQIVPQRGDVCGRSYGRNRDRAWPDRAACRPARRRASSPGGNLPRCNCRCRCPCPA